MSSHNNRFTNFALIISIFALFFLYVLQYSQSANVFADAAQIGGQINGYSCVTSDNRWKIESGNSATLPDGYQIATVVVKAGNNCVSVYPTNTAPTCYEVVINGNTVTVNKIGSGPTCKDVSHLEGTYNNVPTNTPTPTNPITPTDTPTPTITETPTPTPCRQCDPTNTPTPTEDPGTSPTPTNTPGPTNTPTPGPSATPGPGPSATPEPGRGGGEVQGKSTQGQVLGASTLAPTGTFEENMLNLVFVAAALLFALSARRYVSKV